MSKNACLENGVGRIDAVANFYCNLPESEREFAAQLNDLGNCLELFYPGHPMRPAAAAIVAAWLNQRMAEHGWLYTTHEQWDINRQDIGAGSARQVITKLIGVA